MGRLLLCSVYGFPYNNWMNYLSFIALCIAFATVYLPAVGYG